MEENRLVELTGLFVAVVESFNSDLLEVVAGVAGALGEAGADIYEQDEGTSVSDVLDMAELGLKRILGGLAEAKGIDVPDINTVSAVELADLIVKEEG